jgi:hypothetical protein
LVRYATYTRNVQEGLGDEELHAIENLILLCPKHHKIVDEHPEQYDAARLRRIKADHESRVDTTPSPVLHRLIEALARARPYSALTWPARVLPRDSGRLKFS